jgi:hypothetical protein
MGFSLVPREDAYFDFFSQMTEKIQTAANILVEMMQSNSESYEAFAKSIKDAEHECDELTHSSLRFGLGRFNTEVEVDYVIGRVVREVTRLREMSPAHAGAGLALKTA